MDRVSYNIFQVEGVIRPEVYSLVHPVNIAHIPDNNHRDVDIYDMLAEMEVASQVEFGQRVTYVSHVI